MITSRVYALISYFVKYAKAWKSCTFFSRNVFKIGQIADRGLRSRRGVRMCYWLSRNINKFISDKLKNIYILKRLRNWKGLKEPNCEISKIIWSALNEMCTQSKLFHYNRDFFYNQFSSLPLPKVQGIEPLSRIVLANRRLIVSELIN